MTVTSQRSAGSRMIRFFLLAGMLFGCASFIFSSMQATAQDPGTDITTPAAAENPANDGVGGDEEVEQEISEMAPWLDAWCPLWLDKEHFGLRDGLEE